MKKGPAIEIGTIRAGEKVEVAAWSDSIYYDIRRDDTPAIFHSGGSGAVKIKGEFSFLEFLSDYWFPLLLGVLILIGLMLSLSVSIAKQIVASAGESTTSSTVVPSVATAPVIPATQNAEPPAKDLKE